MNPLFTASKKPGYGYITLNQVPKITSKTNSKPVVKYRRSTNVISQDRYIFPTFPCLISNSLTFPHFSGYWSLLHVMKATEELTGLYTLAQTRQIVYRKQTIGSPAIFTQLPGEFKKGSAPWRCHTEPTWTDGQPSERIADETETDGTNDRRWSDAAPTYPPMHRPAGRRQLAAGESSPEAPPTNIMQRGTTFDG